MDRGNIEYRITKYDVYALENQMLDNQNAWCSTGAEDARDRLFWWQGVIDTIRGMLDLLDDRADQISDESSGEELND